MAWERVLMLFSEEERQHLEVQRSKLQKRGGLEELVRARLVALCVSSEQLLRHMRERRNIEPLVQQLCVAFGHLRHLRVELGELIIDVFPEKAALSFVIQGAKPEELPDKQGEALKVVMMRAAARLFELHESRLGVPELLPIVNQVSELSARAWCRLWRDTRLCDRGHNHKVARQVLSGLASPRYKELLADVLSRGVVWNDLACVIMHGVPNTLRVKAAESCLKYHGDDQRKLRFLEKHAPEPARSLACERRTRLLANR